MAGKKIVVIGAVNTDIRGGCLSPVVKHDSNIGYVTTTLGGVGCNIARNLALLGARVSFITAFGSDSFGASAREELSREMDISGSAVTPGRSGTYLYVTDEKGEMYVAVNDMEASSFVTPPLVEKNRGTIESADLVVMDANIPEETVRAVCDTAKCIVAADPVSTLKANRLLPSLPHISIIKPNLMELETLAGVKVDGPDDIPPACRVLLEKDVGAVLVTAGSMGSWWCDRKMCWHASPPRVDVVNANGAGDSFFASFLFSYCMKPGDIPRSLRMATAASVLTLGDESTVSRKLGRNIIEEISREVRVEELS